jgi:hypothetical protein
VQAGAPARLGPPRPATAPGIPGRPRRTRFYDDSDAAEQAWQRAAEVGTKRPARNSAAPTGRCAPPGSATASACHPRPTSRQPAGRLDPVFLALNRRLPLTITRRPRRLAVAVVGTRRRECCLAGKLRSPAGLAWVHGGRAVGPSASPYAGLYAGQRRTPPRLNGGSPLVVAPRGSGARLPSAARLSTAARPRQRAFGVARDGPKRPPLTRPTSRARRQLRRACPGMAGADLSIDVISCPREHCVASEAEAIAGAALPLAALGLR